MNSSSESSKDQVNLEKEDTQDHDNTVMVMVGNKEMVLHIFSFIQITQTIIILNLSSLFLPLLRLLSYITNCLKVPSVSFRSTIKVQKFDLRHG